MIIDTPQTQEIIDFVNKWRTNNNISGSLRLDDVQTVKFAQDLQAELNKVSVRPTDTATQTFLPDANPIPYSANINEINTWIFARNVSNAGDGSLFYISNTPAGNVMDSEALVKATAKTLGGIEEAEGVKMESKLRQGTWDNLTNTRSPYGIGNIRSINDHMSYRMMNEVAHGDIITFTANAKDNFVWSQTEIDALLDNQRVNSIDGTPRTELVQMRDELINTHGYQSTEAAQAVRARIGVQSALNLSQTDLIIDPNAEPNQRIKWIDTHKLTDGRVTNAPEPIGDNLQKVSGSQYLHEVKANGLQDNYAVLRQTATVIHDSPRVDSLNKQLIAYNLISNGAAPEVVESVLHAPAQPTPTLKPQTLQTPELEVKTERLHNGYTKQINQIYAAEHNFGLEHQQSVQTHAAQKIQVRTLSNTPIEPIITSSVSKIHTTEPHINAAQAIDSPHLSKTPHIAGKAIGAAGVAVEVGLGAVEIKQAVDQAHSTREQYISGFEAGGNVAIKSVVTGAAGLGGGIVGGAGGAVTPIPGGTVIGALGVGAAAAYGAGQAYEDSAVQSTVKDLSRGVGEFAYDNISKEGRLAGQIQDSKEQLKTATDPEQIRTVQAQLNQATAAFNLEADQNQRQIDAQHLLDQQYQDINSEYPRIHKGVLNVKLTEAIERGDKPTDALDYAVDQAKILAAYQTPAAHAEQMQSPKTDPQAVAQTERPNVASNSYRIEVGSPDILAVDPKTGAQLDAALGADVEVVQTINVYQGNANQSDMTYYIGGNGRVLVNDHLNHTYTQTTVNQAYQQIKQQYGTDLNATQTLSPEQPPANVEPMIQIQDKEAEVTPPAEARHAQSISATPLNPTAALIARMNNDPEFANSVVQMVDGQIHQAVVGVASTVQPYGTVATAKPQQTSPNESQPQIAWSRTQQSQLDRVLDLMAEKADFNTFSLEHKTRMAMGLMIEATQRGEPMNKLQGVYLPHNGNTLAAQFDTPIGMVHLPTADALKTTPQQLLEAHNPQVSQQQMLQQQLQQSQSTERNLTDVQGVSMPRSNMPIEFAATASLSRTQQGHVDRIVELMAENPEFKVFNPEQQTQMAMGLMVEAAKRGEPMDKLEGVYLPHNGQTLAAQFNTPIGMVHLPTQEALQATPQDVTIAQNNQTVQQQQQEQQRAMEREQSQGRGISL